MNLHIDHFAAICTFKNLSLYTNTIGRGLWRIDDAILDELDFENISTETLEISQQ